MQVSTHYLEHVDGSSIFHNNDTKIVCSVSGPIEPKSRQELPTQLALEIIVRPAQGVQSTREKLIEDQVRAVLTPILARYMHPRQLAQICFQVMETGEPKEYTVKEVSACINAGVLALVDSGVPLLSMCSSVCMCIDPRGQVIIDPSNEKLLEAESAHIISIEIGRDSKNEIEVRNILLLDSVGTFDESQLLNVLKVGEKECIRVYDDLRSGIEEKVAKDFIWKQ